MSGPKTFGCGNFHRGKGLIRLAAIATTIRAAALAHCAWLGKQFPRHLRTFLRACSGCGGKPSGAKTSPTTPDKENRVSLSVIP
jgi:hypothetical protein